MSNLTDLERAKEKALQKYESAKKKLEEPSELLSFSLAAQEANEAWLEVKKLETAYANCMVLLKLEHLYS